MPVDLKTTPQKSLVPADDPGMAGTQIVSPTEGELVAHDEESSDAHPSVGADVSMLTDKTPPWLRASRRMAIITLLVGVAFWFYSIKPVWHADPWSHIAYGKLIVSEGLPATEPLLPLARGMTYWNSSWLFDVLMMNVDRTLGGAGLQGATGIFAGLIVAIFVSSLAYTTGRTLLACGIGMALLFLIGHDLSILRSQLAGMVCFLTAWILWQGAIRNTHAWWQLPLLFAVWANLDSSFMVGLIVPVAMMAGRMVDRWVKTGQWKSILRDQHLGKLLLVTQLCLLATLLNPYQGRMWWEVLTFSQNPNLSAMVDWSPLTLRSTEGQFFAATILILMGVVRSSPDDWERVRWYCWSVSRPWDAGIPGSLSGSIPSHCGCWPCMPVRSSRKTAGLNMPRHEPASGLWSWWDWSGSALGSARWACACSTANNPQQAA